MRDADTVLSWVHFGDLHMTEPGRRNHADFLALIGMVNRHLAGRVDFAVLPGDNADDGSDEQFRLVRSAIDRLRVPLHILPGDHDFQTGSLHGFHSLLGAPALPATRRGTGFRCLFLDTVSAGAGGPDFRLGEAQLAWVRHELGQARAAGETPLVFMHVYPADLRDCSAEMVDLLADYRVACVDMGHTHYNELSNDGRTIFAATRSTGQIEEGPAGFSVGTLDRGVINWKFQPLEAAWPLVMVSCPADHRLIIDAAQVVQGSVEIRAMVWDQTPIRTVSARVGDGAPFDLHPDASRPGLWYGRWDSTVCPDGIHSLRIEATNQAGATGVDTVAIQVSHAGLYTPPHRHADGSDKDAIGAWPEKHIPGTQLGPNRNGRAW